MLKFINTNIGRLRLIALTEGLSLIVLVAIGMPMKYMFHDHTIVKAVGPVHGVLFLLYVLNTLTVAIEYKWKFFSTTWKVLLASFVPFGTFYVDHAILSKMHVKKV
ncbi:MAG: DUF3817 domain-containing protein [Bacteroidota bacterium]